MINIVKSGSGGFRGFRWGHLDQCLMMEVPLVPLCSSSISGKGCAPCVQVAFQIIQEKGAKPGTGTDRREAFIRHYLIHQNAARAYREAGYKDGPGTRQSAHRLLTSAYIQARISEERQKLIAALDVTVETIARRLRDIAFCDIAEIVGCHFGPCRYCHGIDHAYQWRSPAEYAAVQAGDAAQADDGAGPEG